ncbi:MAG: site-2 protease family protein [Candidatus Wildermuthbacteria bacterium]|nr:site-2 protease family protein [Candidatus Wildermuthbacteria bacterium]
MTFLIVFISFLGLVILHELGHFLFAKKFGVKVEEFGIGLPPRIWGKQFGETVYSLNLLPLGAFVRLQGEEDGSADPRSFSVKPIWQRMVIVAAGVIAFWAVAVLIFTGLGATSGIPMGVSDTDTAGISQAKVQIIGVAKDSPAKAGGVQLGDAIVSLRNPETGEQISPTTVTETQEFTSALKGHALEIILERGAKTVEVSVMPRENPPAGEGPLGVALTRSALVRYSLLEAPFKGIEYTWNMTAGILKGLGALAGSLFQGKGAPDGMEFMGPIGIFQVLMNSLSLGVSYFLSFLAMLSVYLAVFNALPIPVVDGGRLVLLGIEAVRKKPLPSGIEKSVSSIFFVLLICAMIFVSIKDILKIF